jgi:hypothetical protein
MKVLKISKCSDSLLWYSNLVGTTVPYLGMVDGEYLTREPSGHVNIIKQGDAIVIETKEEEVL